MLIRQRNTAMRARTARIRRRIALGVSTALVGTLLQGAFTSTAQADDMPGIPKSEEPLSGHGVKMKPRPRNSEARVPRTPPSHAWPTAGSATVTLPTTASTAAEPAPLRAGKLPITLTAPTATKKSPKAKTRDAKHSSGTMPLIGTAEVHVYGQKIAQRAGVNGLLFSLTPKPGATGNSVGVSVDYTRAAQTYGGAYAARLHLVRLPACAVTTPDRKPCSSPAELHADNKVPEQKLTAASVPLARSAGGEMQPVLLAVTAGTSSDHGDYTASKLSQSATWSTNLNTGDFSWSYDMPVPGVPGSFAPKVGLTYSSNAIDGRTSNTNNQSSWVGDGFDLSPGFIERSYKPCADEGVKDSSGNKVGDLCWAYDNAKLSFNGHAGELIPDGIDSFKIKGDDGTKVDRLHGSDTNVRANGAHDDEYWRVTTTDGTRYYFGYNRLPGWNSGDEATDSTWTAPVFGNDSGEPCHGSGFADSWCQQGWRWNLDYSVDVHGNAIAYYYNKETNYYGRDRTAADETPYERGGYLDRIEYGLKSSEIYGAKPLAKVDFTSAERCLPQDGVTCDASSIDDKDFYWYDTPWDTHCDSGKDCYTVSPTFWSRKRLTAVTTEVLKPDGTTYAPVDSWALTHRWGMSDIDYQLLLDSLQHTGKAASPNITLPKVTFVYDQRTNRLNIPGDDTSPFIKQRLSSIADESGGQIDVNYSTAACDAGDLPTPETNTTRCFPQYYTKEGDADPTRQWFNKYVVDSVTQTDRTKASPDTVTKYSYLGGAAWHFDDDDGLTKEKYKTWSTYRGYAHVREEVGGQDPIGMKSQTDHYFLRGMNGDKASPSGGIKSVTVPDDNGGTITDYDPHAGYEYKTEHYSAPGGKVLDKKVNSPWRYQTASRTRSWGTTTANLTGTLHTWTWTSLDDGAGSKWRRTYHSYAHEHVAGRVTMDHDAGDTSTAADNTCTRTTYVDNTSGINWILNTPSRVETVAKACADTPDRSKDVIADVRTAYDGQGYGAAPTRGDATRTATLKSHDGTTATYLESSAGYDSYGRKTSTTDLSGTVTATETTDPVRTDRSDGRTTTTAYSPTTGSPETMTVTTPPAKAGDGSTAQSTTTTLDPIRGVPVTVLDANRKRTDTTYDALGRTLKVWLPNRSKANNDTPNYAFSYTVTDNKPVAVGTTTLAGTGTQTSYLIYDGFLRPRQTQTPGPSGGRLVTDTFRDERGLTAKEFAPYYNNASGPATSLLVLDDALSVETQTWNSYDGLGRVIKSQQIAGNGDGGQVLATTLTDYHGDRTTVTPPQGATPTTTLTDARGNTTELDQYHASTPIGTPDKTLYGYTPAGKLAKITDPAGNVWSYGYDQRGNQTSADDPDKGKTTSVYGDRNELVSTTDARGKKVSHVYDGLGREIETHDGDASGALLTKHVWDPSGYKGQLASATRYVGGASGSAYTTAYQLYDTLYRPHRTTVTIPASEGALAGSYQSNVQYNVDGTVQSTTYPAAGALPSDGVVPTYDEVLRPKTLSGSGGTTYITDTAYSYTGKVLQYTYQADGAKKTQVTNTYQWGTQRLDNTRVDREDVPGTDKSATYGYDQAGNITSIRDVSRDGTDNQCFQYDHLARLSEAWAQITTTCAATPSASVLGGPAPYWQSFGYDAVGNRTTATDHDPTGDTGKDVKRTYTYPAPKAPQPHSLTQVQTTGPNGTSVDSYGYDDTGNTRTRTLDGDKQTLTWDSEGHLASIAIPDGSDGTKTASYLYDADGNRLITRTPSENTLYLGNTEVTCTPGGSTAKATRYYDLGGGNQAIRTNDNELSYLIGDHHGTSQLAITSTDLTMQQRRSAPFGASRGKQPTTWPGTKGFVGGTQDPTTGLTHLGARDYDPTTGRFLSVDPLLNTKDPQSLNAYAYSNNNPVTESDPTGRTICDFNPELEQCGGTGGSSPQTSNDNAWGSYCRHHYCEPSSSGGGGGGGGSTAKGQTTVYPGIDVPTNWKGKRAFAHRFYLYLNTVGEVAPGQFFPYLEDPTNVDGLQQLAFWALKTCKEVHCPKELTAQFARLAAGFAGSVMAQGGEGSGHEGIGGAEASAVNKEIRSAKGSPCNSFDTKTRVLLKDGKTKSIGEVKPGDLVEAADARNGKHRGPRTVTAHLVHRDNDLIDLTIRTKHGHTRTLRTTASHPFWDDSAHAWVPAGKLTVGHALNTATHEHSLVVRVHAQSGSAEMYNLTVEQLHTYYVLAGNTPVLVHNASCPNGFDFERAAAAGSAPGKNGLTRAGYEYQKHMGRGQLPKVNGRTGLNDAGQELLEQILTDPGADFQPVNGGAFKGGFRVIGNTPYGGNFINATFDASGDLAYFGINKIGP